MLTLPKGVFTMKEPTSMDYVRYRDYDELREALEYLERGYCDLIRLETIGTSHQGREILAVTVTDFSTAEAGNKPALYMDCNIHAGEVTTSALALFLIGSLVENHGSDAAVDQLLSRYTLYVIPRIAVDGAEVYLKTPDIIRSVPKTPGGWEEDSFITRSDLNGDGAITLMRVPHPEGEWKISARDDRVMVRREPGELVGNFYKVYPEGHVRAQEEIPGQQHGPVDTSWPIDLNRNYPYKWSPNRKGSGPYPISEPETRAQVDFILGHPNIAAMLAFHTAEGAILKPVPSPPAQQGESEHDLHLFDVLAKFGERHTGYPELPARSFSPNAGGTFPQWAYEHLGQLSYLVEMWDVARAAGINIPREKRGQFYESIAEDDEAQMLRWLDTEFDGEGFVNWEPYDHPDLGAVEIGGWKLKFTRQNPPLPYLLSELRKNIPFILQIMGALPRVQIVRTEVCNIDENSVRVRAVVRNCGYLSTYLTEKALEVDAARAVRVRLDVDEGIIVGSPTVEIGHLEGRSVHGDTEGRRGYNIYGNPLPRFEQIVEWTVRGVDSRRLTGRVTAGTPRAGRCEYPLG